MTWGVLAIWAMDAIATVRNGKNFSEWRRSKVRVLIFGDRNWQNDSIVFAQLVKLRRQGNFIECVIEGEASGADEAGRWAAEALGIPVIPFPADWKKFGKAAGPMRNQQMIDEGKPTYGLGFHNDIESSKGTKDMANRLKKANIPYVIVRDT